MKARAPFTEVVIAARGAALPLVIPVIIMGGILTGWFTPTEAGMIAAMYILVVLIPILRRQHIKKLPGDLMYAGLLYSLPPGAVAGGSAFGGAVVRSLPLYVVFFLTIGFVVMFPKVVLWLPKQLLPESVGCFKSPSGTGYICP